MSRAWPVLFASLGFLTFSPTIEIKDLTLLLGSWQGELEYLDYGDDQSRITLPMRAIFKAGSQEIRFEYFFQEPDGRETADRGIIAPAAGGSKLRLGGDVLELVKMEVLPQEARYVFHSRGQDNGRRASFETTIEISATDLLVAKHVTLADNGRTFVRNSYRLRRVDKEAASTSADPTALLGTWTVDLRPTPNSPPNEVEFVVKSVEGETLSGVFYGSEIEEGRLNADWGTLRFGFLTRDGSGVYYTAGVLRDGKLEGTTHSLGRDFLAVWTAMPSKP